MEQEKEPSGVDGGKSADSGRYPSADLIQHTIRVWEPRLGRPLSEEDARQILANVVGFFRVLYSWNRQPPKDNNPEGKQQGVLTEKLAPNNPRKSSISF